MNEFSDDLFELTTACKASGYLQAIVDSIDEIYKVRSGLSLNPDNPHSEAFNDGVKWATSMLIEKLTALQEPSAKESA